MAAFQLGAAHAGAHAFDDEVAFEFRNGADDHDDGPAQWPSGIELLPETDKLDMEMIEFVQALRGSVSPIGPDGRRPKPATTSKRPRRASAIISSRPGRLALVPLMRSVYSWTIS